MEDLQAVQQNVPGVTAASPVVEHQRTHIESAPARRTDIAVLGVYPEYLRVRNLVVLAGRFFDHEDSQAHNKVGVITEKMASRDLRFAAGGGRQDDQA